MASLGAKVMQPISIQDARLNRIDIEVNLHLLKTRNINYKKNLNNSRIITGITSTQ